MRVLGVSSVSGTFLAECATPRLSGKTLRGLSSSRETPAGLPEASAVTAGSRPRLSIQDSTADSGEALASNAEIVLLGVLQGQSHPQPHERTSKFYAVLRRLSKPRSAGKDHPVKTPAAPNNLRNIAFLLFQEGAVSTITVGPRKSSRQEVPV